MPGKSIPVYAACPTGHGAGNAVNGRVQIKTGFRNGARSNDARIPPGVVKGNVHIRHGTGGAAVGCRSNIQYAGILPAIEPVRINPVVHGSCIHSDNIHVLPAELEAGIRCFLPQTGLPAVRSGKCSRRLRIFPNLRRTRTTIRTPSQESATRQGTTFSSPEKCTIRRYKSSTLNYYCIFPTFFNITKKTACFHRRSQENTEAVSQPISR